MKDAKNPDETEAPGHGQSRPSGPDRQEQYQRTRDQAATGQEEQDRDARSADERTNSGKPREGPKIRQTVTGAAQRTTSTGKTPPFSAKASPARNRASGRRGTLISSVIRASGAIPPRSTMSA